MEGAGPGGSTILPVSGGVAAISVKGGFGLEGVTHLTMELAVEAGHFMVLFHP
jgi:hypothetical protein